MKEFLSHKTQLDALSMISRSVQLDLDPELAPYFDGRIPEGDVRSPALKAALADLLTAADRVADQSKEDLAALKAADRAETLNRERSERAEQGRHV